MRPRAFLGIAALLSIGTLPGPLSAQTPDRAEFLSWKWGTTFEELKTELGLKLFATEGATARYSSTLRAVASIPVTECQFEFVRGRLSGVAFTTGGTENSRRMLGRIERFCGKGNDDPPFGFRWIAGESRISYNEDSQGDAYVYCYSALLQEPGPDGVRAK